MELVPIKIQEGWLRLAAIRQDTFKKLEGYELQAQQYLTNIEQEVDLKTVQTKIKGSKDTLAELKECRLGFTNMLKEKIIDKSMEFEKRCDPLIEAAMRHELKLRKDAEAKNLALSAEQNELADLKTHIRNELVRVKAKYQLELNNMIQDAYKACIMVKRPKEELDAYLTLVRKFMSELTVDKFVKKPTTLVSFEAAKKAFEEAGTIDKDRILAEALGKLDATFAMYEEDLKSGDKALQANTERIEADNKKIEEEADIDNGTNTLMGDASKFSMTGGPAVKRKKEIVEENNPEWALNVIAAFVKNFASASSMLKTKSWANVSIGNMVTALNKVHATTGKTFEKLKLQEVEK